MNGHNETLEELSQIWLHALAVRAGFAYERSGRQLDNLGVDATVHTGNGLLAPDATAASFPIEFQLRATAGVPVSKPKGIPFRLRRLDYDRLRLPVRREPLLLAVMFFPSDPAEWLAGRRFVDPDGIGLHGQAFWANLRARRNPLTTCIRPYTYQWPTS